MLQIQAISKQYKTGELVQQALDGVFLNLRDNEFVSILGPSGSGKTTLLNIIGGLDRYDTGDLVINGISTKEYRDRDWDAYRNHTIGFVFQSYNLIPHQSVLANVELALTISGLGRGERRKRAKHALEEVGLGDQLHKRPNQMSGGQMQRVAIARALVNDPDILLADEPTGALDTETSVQVMELLKKVAEKRLVVMVTHNPELAEAYSTRIVRLRDGRIVDDTDPYEPDHKVHAAPEHRRIGKAKMGFLTALSLSFNNLRTKKGRTLLTSFAGSIGIIGIALILALSTGVNDYIGSIQKETMTSYPITISEKSVDLSGLMGMRGQRMGALSSSADAAVSDGVHADNRELKASSTLNSSSTENDLTAFKQYLDDPDSEIRQYLGENGVVYSYNVSFDVYSYGSDGVLVSAGEDPDESAAGFGAMKGMMLSGSPSSGSGSENFSELMAGTDGAPVSAVITDSYELLSGTWPRHADEAVLVLDRNSALSTSVLYQLGLITKAEYDEIAACIADGEEPDELVLDYASVCGHTFYLVPACDRYLDNGDGTFTLVGDGPPELERLLENAVQLRITGIIRPADGAANASISTAVAYTAGLTELLISRNDESAVVRAQEADASVNVLNGMKFETAGDAEKIEDAKTYIAGLGVSDKAALYSSFLYYSAGSAEDTRQLPQDGTAGGMMQADESTMAAALDRWLAETPDDGLLLTFYDKYISGASYESNLEAFGKVSYDAPATISIYTDSFEAKEAAAECIARYNETVDEDRQITYIDYVELMTSSLTSIVNVISYVLIAFVAVSLVVSCIMIGIITHISVLERTKEIGTLRALGASKRNISQVFNAETIIIGLCAGLLGVCVSAALTVPINALIRNLLDTTTLTAQLPLASAAWLVLLSVAITVLGGLLPARKAAKKDPVIALRTE
ncbi:MAG: ABC transporter ATP-binding protein/permease [Eubacteriales bacterium]|nr:ABC transporter ATP-binding protein/permease [Eubacteriales bacterium]